MLAQKTTTKKHLHHIAYSWRASTLNWLHIGPENDVFEWVKGGYGIAHAMQLSCSTQLMKVDWVKHNGFI